MAQLVCLGTHTVSGLLTTSGRQFQDWSADYRMYSRSRVTPEQLFGPVLETLCAQDSGAIVAAMDDTHLRKTGTKIHGVKYARDPLGPPFRVNFIRAQRFVQSSMAYKGKNGEARMVPIDWMHAPVPAKPKKDACEEDWKKYREQAKEARVSNVGAQRIQHLRDWLDQNGHQERRLWMSVDGSYTNGTVLKQLPDRTTLIGRTRGDTKLYHLPGEQNKKGRRRVYGERAPTPEEMRQDDTVPWKKITVFYGGKKRELRVKQLGPLRWRKAGANFDLQLIIIAPTPYRLSKNSKLLYRKPAFLLCTDPEADLQEIIQYYLWRWDIEVNFRDEKSLLGVGEAQVRTPQAVQNVTGCAVAAYAMLITAAIQSDKDKNHIPQMPKPKWQRSKKGRTTTMSLIQTLRYELWAQAIHFSSFKAQHTNKQKPEKCTPDLKSALFCNSSYS